MQYLEATDSNGTELYLFQLEDNSFISIPKEQLEFKPLSLEEMKGLEEVKTMRPIDAEALISELEKDEKLFDKEAEEARNNPSAYMEGYSTAMWSRANGIRDAIIEIHDAPTINQSADRLQGEWIEMYRNGFGNMICMCSKCSFHATKSNFCPNCGAKMKGVDNENPSR